MAPERSTLPAGNLEQSAVRGDLAGRAVYLLIEDAGRELDSRILIAQHLLERGAEVWIGQQLWFVRNFTALRPGVALFKGTNIAQVANMRAARLAGHRTASIDEELFGLIGTSGKRMHDPRAGRHCDVFLAQGAAQHEFLRDSLGIPADSIRITGNPRADLLRAPATAPIDRAAEEIRGRMGPFVLINTNISGINPHDQDTYNYYRRCIALNAIDPDNPESVESFHQLCAFETENLRAIAAFIAAFRAAAPDRKLVIRPHPAEDPNSWRNAHGGDPGIEVVEDKRHLAWIRAADALVHTSCTTGLESALLGTRTIGLVPDPGNPYSRRYISNLVSEIHQDPARAARALADGGSAPAPNLTAIGNLIHIDPDEMAAAKTAGALAGLSITISGETRTGRPEAGFRSFTPSGRQRDQMTVPEATLRGRLRELGSAIGLAEPVNCEAIQQDVFRLRPDSPRVP